MHFEFIFVYGVKESSNFIFLPILKSGCYFSMLSCMSSLYTLDINPWSDILVASEGQFLVVPKKLTLPYSTTLNFVTL